MRRLAPLILLVTACAAPAPPTCVEAGCPGQQLCDEGACVEPWRFGAPVFDTCRDEPLATPESLAEKARYYDDAAARLHVVPELGAIAGVTLKPGVDADTATLVDVAQVHSGDNDGLWSSLYLASQVYRYAATKDPAALDMLRVLVAGEEVRARVTGIPGLFVRRFVPAGIEGLACPTSLASYVPDVEKDDNRWVKVGDDGCAAVVDGDTMAWRVTGHCGLDELAGGCFQDDVSKDEYAGHVMALGLVVKLVDDPPLQEQARAILADVGALLVAGRLVITDWDGRAVEHGRLYAGALDDYPGFNAAMAMSFLVTAAATTGRADLMDFYRNCLLQDGGEVDCLQRPLEAPRSYVEVLPETGIFGSPGDCQMNFNNLSMHTLSLVGILDHETDPAVAARVRQTLDLDVMRSSSSRAALVQHNPWFNYLWAAHKSLGPGTEGPAFDVVTDAACALRQFPARYVRFAIAALPDEEGVCLDRFDDPMWASPRPASERCAESFVWWKNPYDVGGCTADPRRVEPPQGYLLPYWMGRYYGFLDETD